ncbi:hypothetical protein [Arcanobacterium hippocoleae]|uniref:Uncharacterized protein n=1 Tax=Arcanobacterium hippocoleae TaxID=149017 RepID=A0ABU1T3P9_9ACTO|nr:hypothetical protein [Arcanobacterium hippocoleae]MDR6939881.1 hypothetical protein [Arcanobacterium hippocoleae]
MNSLQNSIPFVVLRGVAPLEFSGIIVERFARSHEISAEVLGISPSFAQKFVICVDQAHRKHGAVR